MDQHHTTEDTGIAIGEALVLGEQPGHVSVPTGEPSQPGISAFLALHDREALQVESRQRHGLRVRIDFGSAHRLGAVRST